VLGQSRFGSIHTVRRETTVSYEAQALDRRRPDSFATGVGLRAGVSGEVIHAAADRATYSRRISGLRNLRVQLSSVFRCVTGRGLYMHHGKSEAQGRPKRRLWQWISLHRSRLPVDSVCDTATQNLADMANTPNPITGANAGGSHWLLMRTLWAARVAQFFRSP
jgi:hypothetical protein